MCRQAAEPGINTESRHKTAFSTIAKAWLRGSIWSGHLAFVRGLFLPMLVWGAAIRVSLPGPGISVPPYGHRQLSNGAKLPTTQALLLACRVAELGSRWCEVSQEVTAQAGVRPGRGDWNFIRKIIFLIHGWMMYLYQIKQVQAQKQCIRES